MCAAYCDYGMATEEQINNEVESYKDESFINWHQLHLDDSIYKNKHPENYESLAIKKAIEIYNQIEDTQIPAKVLVKSEYFCGASTETYWVIEIVGNDNVKILYTSYDTDVVDVRELLKSLNIKIIAKD